ncbi:MAG: tetratricopeptide repeat protein [Thiolinea sp.]
MDLASKPLQYQDICYDPDSQSLFSTIHGRLELRPKSIAVFLFLIQNTGRIVTKDEIFDAVWGHKALTPDSIVQCVTDIRRILGDNKRKILQTVPRRGYRLIEAEIHSSPVESVLPEALLPLLGRDREISELLEMLGRPTCRLICLLGLGGVGKSRLAQAVGKSATNLFSDGVRFVPLAAIRKGELLAEAVARAAGIPLQGNRSASEQLLSELRQREMLLILDNMEQLSGQAAFCQNLLEQAAGLKILVTSRVAPDIYGGWNYYLQGLAIPDNSEDVSENAAYQLFVQSAQRMNYAFHPAQQDIAPVIDICRLVGGMPLGIEVAAAWTQHLSCGEILTGMREYSSLSGTQVNSTTSMPGSPLTTVLQRSWKMLSQREQQIMQVLGMFRGRFSREAAMAVAGAEANDFMQLISKSMLTRDGEGYFILHEVMRQYAGEQAQQSVARDVNVRRFLDYHLQRAQQADAEILGGEQFNWLVTLGQEHPNFRECLALCMGSSSSESIHSIEQYQGGLALAGSLGWFWFLANHWQEGRNWAEQFLQLNSTDTPTNGHSLALLTAGGLATLMDDYPVAEKRLSAGIAMARSLDHNNILSRGLAVMSILYRLRGEFDEAILMGRESIQLFRQQQDWGGYMLSLGWLGQSLVGQGQYRQALPVFEECLQLNRRVGNTISLPHALVNLGYVQWKLGENQAARIYLKKAVETSEQCGVLLYHAQALCFYGWLEITDGHYREAATCFQKSARDYLQLGDNTGLAEVLEGMAGLAVAQGSYNRAAQLIAGAEGVRSRLAAAPHPESGRLARQVMEEVKQRLSASELALNRNLGLACGVEELVFDFHPIH